MPLALFFPLEISVYSTKHTTIPSPLVNTSECLSLCLRVYLCLCVATFCHFITQAYVFSLIIATIMHTIRVHCACARQMRFCWERCIHRVLTIRIFLRQTLLKTHWQFERIFYYINSCCHYYQRLYTYYACFHFAHFSLK